ncbi:hypothetical protein LCL97_07305 [Seohaeicola saemankumensis]|nr:hypothetical protein [Seohaeicola saemankumensis]MCA0870624.1 hypothetical protein [Seohaeicola saemankumensis]
MKEFISMLEGLKLTSIRKIEDYIQLVFDDGTILTVFNDHEITPEAPKLRGGVAFLRAVRSAESVRLVFGSNISIEIQLDDSSYYGPEAMTLHNADQSKVIVWR